MGMDVYALEESTSNANGSSCEPELHFRDSYGPHSLANWLTRNVDAGARGAWGLAIFTEPTASLNSPAWRAQLLQLATTWVERAGALRGQMTSAGYPEDSPEPVSPEQTASYIRHCEALLHFATQIDRRGLKVIVWA